MPKLNVNTDVTEGEQRLELSGDWRLERASGHASVEVEVEVEVKGEVEVRAAAAAAAAAAGIRRDWVKQARAMARERARARASRWVGILGSPGILQLASRRPAPRREAGVTEAGGAAAEGGEAGGRAPEAEEMQSADAGGRAKEDGAIARASEEQPPSMQCWDDVLGPGADQVWADVGTDGHCSRRH